MVSTIQGFNELRDANGNLFGPLGFGFQADWEIIDRQVVSAAATVELGIDLLDPTLYDELEIVGLDVLTTTDIQAIDFDVSDDNGSTYEGGTGYEWDWHGSRADTGARLEGHNDADASIEMYNNFGSVAGDIAQFRIRTGAMDNGTSKSFIYETHRYDGATSVNAVGAAVFQGNTNNINAFRFTAATGNLTGTFILRGRRKTPVSLISQDDWVVITDDIDVAAATTHDYFWDDNVYDEIEVTWTAALTGTDIRNLAFRISSDGSTFHSGGTDYEFAMHNFDAGGGSAFTNGSTGAAEAKLFNAMGTAADELNDGVLHLMGVSNSARKQKWLFESVGQNSNGDTNKNHGGGIDVNTDDRTQGIQLRSDGTATVAFDRVRIRGRRKTPTGVLKQDWEVLDTWSHADTGDIAEIEWVDIPSTEFDEFELVLLDMNTGTSSNTLILQFSNDNGATWDTGNNYQYAYINASADSTPFSNSVGDAVGHIALSANFGLNDEKVCTSVVRIDPLDGTGDRSLKMQTTAVNDSDNLRNQTGGGRWEGHTGITTAFRLDLLAGGNFTGGRAVLRGRRKQPL